MFALQPGISIVAPEALKELGGYLSGYLSPALDSLVTVKSQAAGVPAISLAIDTRLSLKAEGYALVVDAAGVAIRGKDRGGVFNGIQTLLQLLPTGIYAKKPLDSLALGYVTITDYPRFGYRGMMLDVSRTFASVDVVKQYLDMLSHHKINKFHWHLADDEGWRIEIKSVPDLARVGGFRGGDSPVKGVYGLWDEKYGGYYTQEEVREIVGYARLRNIEIIPEIDLPGHSRCAARVNPAILCTGPFDSSPALGYDRRNVWCVSKEQNYKILEKVIAELAQLFPCKTIHIGGDEVEPSQWKACPNCQKLADKNKKDFGAHVLHVFVAKMDSIAKKYNRNICAWDEAIESGSLKPGTMVTGWRESEKSLEATAGGYKTIVMPSPFFYFDARYSPYDRGLTWMGMIDVRKTYSFNFEREGFKAEHMKNVLGLEGALWGETGLEFGKGFQFLRSYPRICALSEAAWTPQADRVWEDFHSRLTDEHLYRLAAAGIPFLLPDLEVKYDKGVITAAIPYKPAVIRYTTDGTAPTQNSALYTAPISDRAPEHYQFRAFSGDAYSPVAVPVAPYETSIKGWTEETVVLKVKDYIDRPGTWLFRLLPLSTKVYLNNLEVAEKTIISRSQRVNHYHVMRLRIDSAAMEGEIKFKVVSKGPGGKLRAEFSPSPWIEPEVTVTSSMTPYRNFPLTSAGDYNMTSYSRTTTTCKQGDYFLFTFTEPVECHSLEVGTGLSFLRRNLMWGGRVEVCYQGSEVFQAVDTLVDGAARIFPKEPVKAVKVVSTRDGNGESYVAIQDLKITPVKVVPFR